MYGGRLGKLKLEREEIKRLGVPFLFMCGVAAWAGSGQALAANAPTQGLDRYVGKYPSQKIASGPFLKNPRVVAAINAAVHDPKIRGQIFSKGDIVETPIIVLSAHRLFTRSFDPAHGGGNNWAILMTIDGKKSAVCWDPGDGEGRATWFADGEKAFDLSGSCPSERSEIESSLGTWPVGGVPG